MQMEQHHQTMDALLQRRDLKFHVWPHLDPQPTIVALLAEINDPSNGAFWG